MSLRKALKIFFFFTETIDREYVLKDIFVCTEPSQIKQFSWTVNRDARVWLQCSRFPFDGKYSRHFSCPHNRLLRIDAARTSRPSDSVEHMKSVSKPEVCVLDPERIWLPEVRSGIFACCFALMGALVTLCSGRTWSDVEVDAFSYRRWRNCVERVT